MFSSCCRCPESSNRPCSRTCQSRSVSSQVIYNLLNFF
ncbi:unnamed protein product [Linum tenue]|uniref:Uncharacterized protein n=1 Tax=Linum tenue TaxID=586396 RepID=A0AAV0HGC8_9ROSI|nr:unnamed protein product [Linum tenue]